MKRKPLPRRSLSFLHLGDSYTIGEGVEAAHSWPNQLRQMLEIKGWRIGRLKIVAKTGWTTADLKDAIEWENLRPEWDVVTVCIGVNNQYQGRDLHAFQTELAGILNLVMTQFLSNDGQVFLLSIPDWGVSPFAADRDKLAIQAEIERFNAVCSKTARSLDIPFIEWTSLSRLFENEPNGFAADRLHPSADQYMHWATFVLQYLIPGI